MGVGRAIRCGRSGEEREEEVENLVPVGQGETSIDDSLHSVGEETDVVGLFVNTGDDVQSTRLQRDADSLRCGLRPMLPCSRV